MSALTRREGAIVAALADAVAAPEPPLPAVAQTDTVAAFETFLAHAPRANRFALRAVLHALDLAPRVTARSARVGVSPTESVKRAKRGGSRLRFISREERLAVLRELGRSRVPGLKELLEAVRASASVCYFGDAGVMRAVGHDSAAHATRARAARRPDPAPDPEVVIRGETVTRDTTLTADVVIVGSGAGGAPAAKELAEGGMRVIVLEEGDRHPSGDFGRPRDTFPRLYRDGGQVVTLGNPPIALPLGCGVGGTTVINSGTCFRTPDAVLERWRSEFGLAEIEDMTPWFERVEAEIGVNEVSAELAGNNAAAAKRGADALGWSSGFLRRNARGCIGSGVCAFGCPVNAKQHMGLTYMPKAWAAGAHTYTGTRARRVLVRGSRATGVEAVTRGGAKLTIRASTVLIAAGTIHTPGLLERSGLGLESGELGRNLSIHPATAVWARFPGEEIGLARGVPQSFYVDEFAADGIMLEGVGGPPDYVAMAMPFAGARQRELLLDYAHLAQLGVMVSDKSRGRVVNRFGRALVFYDVGPEDVAAFRRGIEALTELWWAAGADSVLLPLAKLPELHGGDSGPLHDLSLTARDLKLMAFHPLGTARAHADLRRGVVDGFGRVHGTENVYVADGSAVPSSLGVNPQETIMAFSTRLAHHVLSH